MPINLASYIQPRNATNPDPALRNTYYLLEDIFVKGGYHVRADVADRDSINVMNLKPGMLVYTLAEDQLWLLNSDGSWKAFSTGAKAELVTQTVSYTTAILGLNMFEEFSLDLGKTIIVKGLSLTAPVTFEIFPTKNRSVNTYKFIATADHLVDDGSVFMSDTSIQRGRRFQIVANEETPEAVTQYFRITNSSPLSAQTTVQLVYSILE